MRDTAPPVRHTAPMGILLAAACASLAAWLWLTLAQGMFWRTDVRLPPRTAPARWPSVAIVVPARDEAEVLPRSLPSLLAQDYPGAAEVILVDDGSTDGTSELARRLAGELPGLPLTVVSPGAPEPGWTGKLWALRHGIAHARTARPTEPEYLLLTDADIAHEPDSLRELVAAATSARLDLVSLMARLRVATFWERLVVPAFVYFFAQLYPFRRINRPGGRTAAAMRRLCAPSYGGRRPRRGARLDPAGRDRRRLPRPRRPALRWPDLARAGGAGGQRAPVPGAGRPVADGLAERLRPTAPPTAAAGGDGGRARARLPRAGKPPCSPGSCWTARPSPGRGAWPGC